MNFLWLLSLFIAVPLLVHLFSFKRAKKYYFSTIRFISSLTTKSRSKSRLKHFLILTSRTLLFISILLFVFILLKSNSKSVPGDYLIYYDNSLSNHIEQPKVNVKSSIQQIVSKKSVDGVYLDNLNNEIIRNDDYSGISEEESTFSLSPRNLKSRIQETNVSNVYLISDFQSYELNQDVEFLVDTLGSFHYVLTNNLNEYSNIAVDTLFVNPNPDNLSELSIAAGFNVFNMESGKIIIKLLKGSRQLSSVVKDISELNQVEFDIPIDMAGDFNLIIDGDEVAYDNDFHFVISKRAKPRVVIIDEKGIVNHAFSNRLLFELSQQSLSNLDYEFLKTSDLIVINSTSKLPTGILNQFSEKQFLIFPSGNDIDVNNLVNINTVNTEPSKSEIIIDENHPLLTGVFDEKIDEGLMPSVYKAYAIEGSYETIIPFRDDDPFLLKTGNVYFFNTVLKEPDGFQSDALFLPLLYQIAFTSTQEIKRPYYYPGDKILVQAEASDIPVKIKNQSTEVIPPFNSSPDGLVLEIPDEMVAGKYFLVREGDTLQQLAINIPKKESVMRAPTLDELETTLSNYPNVYVSSIGEADNDTLLGESDDIALWKYALILALLFVLSETMLHRYLK
ncbi:N-terminal double-transmembrane domain-containing protein [Ekhidna lutea]|uniref:N-terminal double-transmembrane domain-containing protein n=1 Tax=Ekhidna lutea TaxID=447679 RepID=A0A239K709_EKHLU|nr:BatA domain-containing protein [Ekhidna lutea]SNT13791.1 N-terminal double-transmembrane domain-containing protein [Ekhidna lutea]